MATAAAEHEMLPIPLDLYEVKDEEGFLDELTNATMEALAPYASSVKTAGRGLARIVRAGAKGFDLEDELEALLSLVEEARDPVEATLNLPDRAGKLRRKSVLLCIDEAQRMSLVSKDFKRMLHRALRDSGRVSLLLAGTNEGVMRDLVEDPFAPVAALVAHRSSLEPITEDEWRRGLQRLFRIGGCTIDLDAIERIIKEAKEIGVSPVHSTVVIAHHTHLQAVIQGSNHVDTGLAMRGFVIAEPDLQRIGRAAS